jgi:hypothetical protein
MITQKTDAANKHYAALGSKPTGLSGKSLMIMWCAALILTVVCTKLAQADGDKTNSPHVYSTPDQIDEYVPIGGTWVRKLNRVQLPNGRFMLDPANTNYWRDFKQYPCSYRLGYRDDDCINPGDTYRDKLINVTKKPEQIPEPHPLALLLTPMFVYVAYKISKG